MTIQVGDKIPAATLKYVTPEGPKDITTDELFGGKKVVLFAVPGAFTPACSQRHLPGYVDKAGDLKKKGIDTIACIAVNDQAVMGAWGKAQNVGDKVMMLADGSGDFARAVGLELDARGRGLGWPPCLRKLGRERHHVLVSKAQIHRPQRRQAVSEQARQSYQHH